MFGEEIERYVGPRAVAGLLFRFGGNGGACAIVGSVCWPLRRSAQPWAPRAAFSACCWRTQCCFPHRKVVPLIPPIPMPAWLFATIYAGIELFLGVTGTLSGIAHFAHLGGMIGSALVIMQWRASARKTR